MIKHKYIIWIGCMVISLHLKAQSFDWRALPLQVSYYGDNGIHPGIKLGTTYAYKTYEKAKTRRLKKRQAKFGDKLKVKQLSALTNIGFYSHPNNDFGLFINLGAGYERIKTRKGNLFGVNLEIGYLRSINQFKTEKLNDQGEIEQVFFAGQNGIIIGLSPVFGRDLMFKRGIPVKWYVKPSPQLVKYNHGWFPNAALELGIIMNLNLKQDEK